MGRWPVADNTTLNLHSSDGDVVRNIDKSGVKTAVTALDVGGAGAESLVTTNNPLPVTATALGAPADAAAGSDSATAGLVSLVKRLLARITTLVPAALTGSGNFKVAVAEQTAGGASEANSVFVAGTLTNPTRVAVAVSASGSSQLVAAVAGKRILVLGGLLVADAAVTIKFVSGATDITGTMALSANGGLGLSPSPLGHLRGVNVNEALNINLSSAVNVGGWLTYVTV